MDTLDTIQIEITFKSGLLTLVGYKIERVKND